MLDKMKEICFGKISVYCSKQDVCHVRTFFCCGLMTISFQQQELGK